MSRWEEWRFLVPTAKNDGTAFDVSTHAWFETEILKRFGGFTRLADHACGAWKDGQGVVHWDCSLPIALAIPGTLKDRERLLSFLNEVRVRYEQAVLYVTGPGGSVTFLDGSIPSLNARRVK